MKRIIESTMQRAILVIICIVLILAWGGVSAFQMQRDYLPGINNTTLLVSLRATAYQADQMKKDITAKIEDGIRSSDGLVNVETTSYDGGMLMNLYFPMNFDMGKAESEIKQALNNVVLPTGVAAPTVTRVTTSSFPILSYGLTANKPGITETALRSSVQTDIVKQLKSVPGVAEVRVTGAANNGYVITVRTKDLAKNGLTLDDFNQSVSASLPNWSKGKIANNQVSIPLNVESWNISNEELGNIQIKNKQGIGTSLSNVADLSQSMTDIKTISRTDGKASVLLDIIKTPSSNITDVADKVKTRVQQITAVKNGDVILKPSLDREQDLNLALKGLVREGLLGCLFSMLCVFFFFRNVRSTLLIALSLPISLLATTAILKSMGITLNILTVSGLIVAMGRIVDDAIVILDNMYRKIQENKGKPILHTLASAVNEMLPAIFASTATTIAVFVPISLVGGIIGSTFSGFAWSVVIALIISFFVAMLVIPAIAYMGWKDVSNKAVTLEPIMKPVLQFAMNRKKTVVSISLILFLIAIFFATQLPINLLPVAKSGQVSVKIELPKGSALPEVDAEVKKVEDILRSNANVASFSANFGSNNVPQADDVYDAGGGFIQPANVANMSVALKDKNNLNASIQELQSAVTPLSNKAVFTVTNQNIAGDDSQTKIRLMGADQQTLEDTANVVRTKLAAIPGLSVDGKTELTNGISKFTVVLDRNKIEQAGVEVADINKILDRYLPKSKDFTIPSEHGDIPVDMTIDSIQTKESKIPNSSPADVIASLAAETVNSKDGQQVRLDQLATIKENKTPSTIQERDGEPYAVVTVNVISNDINKVSNAVDSTLKNMQLPSGVTYSLGGITEQIRQMILEIAIAIVASILLVLFITSSVFKGWRAPFSVLLSIPLALSGVVVSLFLINGEWNLAALVGLLMLTGIVVSNGIVLIDKIERNRREGMALREAVMHGSLSRVRPIFMTAGTTVLTLIPLALTHSADTVISQTLGIVVIGGMITSTLNSFIVIPIIYEWLQGKKAKEDISTKQSQSPSSI